MIEFSNLKENVDECFKGFTDSPQYFGKFQLY